MISRRGLVRGISSLTIGGVLGALPGTAAATPPDPTSFHATGRTADAGTTLTARLDPALLGTVGLPASVGAIRSDLRDRYPSIDPAAFGPVLTSTGIDGDRVVSGCAVAEGPVNDEFRQALSPASSEAFDDAGFGTGFEHGSVPEPGYAVGVTDSTLAVGYGPSDAAAIDHAASGARHATGNAGADRVAPAELSGDAVAYVTLGDEARSRLQSRADGSVDGLDALLAAAEAFGVAIEADRTASRLRYGIVAAPSSLSIEQVRSLAKRAIDGHEGDFDIEAVSRHGRLFVVEAAVGTGAIWRIHGRVLEALSE